MTKGVAVILLKSFVGEIFPKLLNELLPVLWIILLLASLKPVNEEFNREYLSKKNCNQLRGFLALTILLYHTSQKTETGILLPWFSTFGYLAVSVFYFFSGYGLQKSYERNKDYKDWFLLKRLPKVVIPYLIAVILFWIMNNCLLGKDLSTKDVLKTFLSGHPIVTYSWYIISIVNYYVMFWLLMKICGNNKLTMLIGACVWHMAYIFLCWKMGYSTWWYSDGHLLIIGMAWAAYEDQILKFFCKTSINPDPQSD